MPIKGFIRAGNWSRRMSWWKLRNKSRRTRIINLLLRGIRSGQRWLPWRRGISGKTKSSGRRRSCILLAVRAWGIKSSPSSWLLSRICRIALRIRLIRWFVYRHVGPGIIICRPNIGCVITGWIHRPKTLRFWQACTISMGVRGSMRWVSSSMMNIWGIFPSVRQGLMRRDGVGSGLWRSETLGWDEKWVAKRKPFEPPPSPQPESGLEMMISGVERVPLQ